MWGVGRAELRTRGLHAMRIMLSSAFDLCWLSVACTAAHKAMRGPAVVLANTVLRLLTCAGMAMQDTAAPCRGAYTWAGDPQAVLVCLRPSSSGMGPQSSVLVTAANGMTTLDCPQPASCWHCRKHRPAHLAPGGTGQRELGSLRGRPQSCRQQWQHHSQKARGGGGEALVPPVLTGCLLV